MKQLDEQAMKYVSEYFQALAEPMRLKLLNALREKSFSVNELAASIGGSQANVSKHLGILTRLGFVIRKPQGNIVFYEIADESVYELCDLVCGKIADRLKLQLNGFEA